MVKTPVYVPIENVDSKGEIKDKAPVYERDNTRDGFVRTGTYKTIKGGVVDSPTREKFIPQKTVITETKIPEQTKTPEQTIINQDIKKKTAEQLRKRQLSDTIENKRQEGIRNAREQYQKDKDYDNFRRRIILENLKSRSSRVEEGITDSFRTRVFTQEGRPATINQQNVQELKERVRTEERPLIEQQNTFKEISKNNVMIGEVQPAPTVTQRIKTNFEQNKEQLGIIKGSLKTIGDTTTSLFNRRQALRYGQTAQREQENTVLGGIVSSTPYAMPVIGPALVVGGGVESGVRTVQSEEFKGSTTTNKALIIIPSIIETSLGVGAGIKGSLDRIATKELSQTKTTFVTVEAPPTKEGLTDSKTIFSITTPKKTLGVGQIDSRTGKGIINFIGNKKTFSVDESGRTVTISEGELFTKIPQRKDIITLPELPQYSKSNLYGVSSVEKLGTSNKIRIGGGIKTTTDFEGQGIRIYSKSPDNELVTITGTIQKTTNPKIFSFEGTTTTPSKGLQPSSGRIITRIPKGSLDVTGIIKTNPPVEESGLTVMFGSRNGRPPTPFTQEQVSTVSDIVGLVSSTKDKVVSSELSNIQASSFIPTTSVFAGLGLYEKTTGGGMIIGPLREKDDLLVVTPKPSFDFSGYDKNTPLIGTKNNPLIREGLTSKDNTLPRDNNRPRDDTLPREDSRTRQESRLRDKTRQDYNSISLLKTIIRNREESKIKIPKISFGTTKEVKPLGESQKSLYKIFKRIKGQDLLIGSSPSSKGAFDKLKSSLRSDLSASGFIIRDKVKIRPFDYSGGFTQSKKDPFRLVQRKETRLSSSSEIFGIQRAKKNKSWW